ncbi:hypothetical protein Tco_0222163 [Tanacetum coccineum]
MPDYQSKSTNSGRCLIREAAVCALFQRNLDIIAWEPKHMTGKPRSITEHKLKIRQGYSPVRQKKRGQAPERAKAILEELAGLNRFLSKSADKSLPLFKTLKKYTKKGDFRCTIAAEEAFPAAQAA